MAAEAERDEQQGAPSDVAPREAPAKSGQEPKGEPAPKSKQADGRPAKADDGAGDTPKNGEKKTKKKGLKDHPLLLAAGVGVLGLAAIGGLLYWLHARDFESTDDAFVDAHIVRLAPQVPGRVTRVLVDDNQLVQPGQVLIELDSADAETRVAQADAQRAQAQAQVDNARAQIAANRAAYQQALADTAAAQAQYDNAARDLARYRNLQRTNPLAVSQQQIDQAEFQAKQAAAQRDAARKAAEGRAEQVKASLTQVASGEDQVRAARSQLNAANINLGYNRIVAPVAGHIAQKTVAPGNYAQAGTQLMAVVPLATWVTANFKETQLALMRVGQSVTIKVDACPGGRITGRVDSIQRGAGQAFGILPPENATGNFVKVVQRVPVKIVFDTLPRDCPLGPGMSVEPTVRVR